MPLDTPVGASYICLTCGTTYRHLIGGWTLAGPIVDLAPELQNPDPIDCNHDESLYGRCVKCGMTWETQARLRYETTLDQDERTGN